MKKKYECIALTCLLVLLLGCGDKNTLINNQEQTAEVETTSAENTNYGTNETAKNNEETNVNGEINDSAATPVLNAIKETHYDKHNNIDRSSINEYDKDDHLIKETLFDGNGNITRTTIHEYDKNGNLIKIEANDTINPYYEIIYQYDENNNLLNSKAYSDGVISSSYDFTYYSNGNKETARSNDYNLEGKLIAYSEEEYSEKNGNKISQTYYELNNGNFKIDNYYEYSTNDIFDGGYTNIEMHYDSDGTVLSEYYSQYDSDGNHMCDVKFSGGYQQVPREYVYDEDGNCIKTTVRDYDSHGNIKRTSIFNSEYNNKGLCTKETWYENNETNLISTTITEYDSYDRKVKVSVYSGENDLLEYTTYEYTFYE